MAGRLQRTINIVENNPIRAVTDIDTYLKSVKTKTFGKKKERLIKILTNSDTPFLKKFKILNFFCNKLANIYRLNDETVVLFTESLYSLVREGTTLPIATRLYYTRFQNEIVPFKTSIKLYENNIREDLEHIPYFQILKYILRNSRSSEEIRTTILEEFERLFTDPHVNGFIKMEIADIFLLNNRTVRGNEMLAVLRGFIRVEEAKDSRTVYDDSQNVHDANVNKSVLTAAHRLIEIFSETEFDRDNVIQSLERVDSKCKNLVNTVLDRVEIDTARFSHKYDKFSLYNVFSNLWAFIIKNKESEELKKRLLQELTDMNSYCSTGHLSRFINVIQGYTEDPKLCIRISEKSQIKAVLTRLMETLLGNAPEDVMDSMIGDQQLFMTFIVSAMNKQFPKLFEEYGNEDEDKDTQTSSSFLSAIVSYTRCDKFDIVDKKLVIKKEEEIKSDPRSPSGKNKS